MKKTHFLSLVIFNLLMTISIDSFSQKENLPTEIQERYYSSEINVGEINKSLYDSLESANTMHPSRFYEICGTYVQKEQMNEATVAYFVGNSRFWFYNKTNPKYEASGDGALNASLSSSFGEVIYSYLNLNLDNYAELIKKSGEWYRDNKHNYFKNSVNDSLYQLQVNSMLDLSNQLKSNPEEYIAALELERMEIEALIEEMNAQMENSNVEENFEEEETILKKRPTSEVPGSFLINHNGETFILNSKNEISAIAHGYYDTYVESSDAKIIQNESNPLYYSVEPYKLGDCKIMVYGVSEKGKRAALGLYTFKVVKNK